MGIITATRSTKSPGTLLLASGLAGAVGGVVWHAIMQPEISMLATASAGAGILMLVVLLAGLGVPI